MKNSKKTLCMALSFVACLCIGAATGIAFNSNGATPVLAAEEVTYNADEVKMLDGAEIRLTAENHGIRFSTFIGNEVDLTATYGADYELGTLFVPKNAITDVSQLTVDASFNGIKPAKAVWDGNTAKLTQKTGYENGKFFNAVLDLSSTGIEDASVYLNNTIVARSYVKKASGEVVYLGSAERAPAYVAAVALDGGDTDELLETYVSEVEIDLDESYNLAIGGDIPTATVNVAGIPLIVTKFTADTEKMGTITATAAGGKITATANVSVLGEKVTFKNNYYTPDGSFTYTAYGVTDVTVDGQAIDYTYEGNTLTIKKADVLGGKFTVVANTSIDVPVGVYTASLTGFGASELQAEVLGELDNLKVEETDGRIKLAVIDTSKDANMNLNADYVKAMFAYPNMNKLQLDLYFENIVFGSSADIMYYKSITTDGTTTEYGTSVASATTRKGAGFTRAMYNMQMAANAMDVNVGVKLKASKMQEGAAYSLDRIVAPRADGYTFNGNEVMVNNIYADVQAVMANGGYKYIASSEATLSSLKINESEFVADGAHSQKGSTIDMSPALVNSRIRTNEAVVVTSYADGATKTAYAEEIFALNTKLFIDDKQYINKDEEALTGNYVLDLGTVSGQRVKSVKLNGTALDLSAYDNGKVTVDKAMLKSGHNVVEVIVERDVAHNSVLVTATDTYLRSICVIEDADLWSAMTFESKHQYRLPNTFDGGRMNPFLSILGATATTVSSKEINTYYYSNCRTGFVKENTDGTIAYKDGEYKNNEAVMKLEIPAGYTAQLYIPTNYIVARREKVAETYAKMTTEQKYYSAICNRIYVQAGEGSGGSWTTYVEGDTATNYASTATSGGDSSIAWGWASRTAWSANRFMYTTNTDPYSVIYDSETKTILKNYIYIQMSKNTSSASTFYIDELFNAGSSQYLIASNARVPLSTIYK